MPPRANPAAEMQARLDRGDAWPTNLSAVEFDALVERVKVSAPMWEIGLSHILDIIEQPTTEQELAHAS